jgi:hypothetical protein
LGGDTRHAGLRLLLKRAATDPHKPAAPLPQVGNLEAAVDVYRDMQAAGRPPNVVTSCGLIAALGRERRRRGVRYAHIAHELWTELCGSGVQLDGAAYRTG